MPVKPENRDRYPADWPEIRLRILERAGHKCEWCRVEQYAVGYRGAGGRFVPAHGNGPLDAAGTGRSWPDMQRWTHADARDHADRLNTCGDRDDDGRRWIVVVLTVAHIDDPDPANCADENLALLCQRCHNRHDAPLRRLHASETRREGKAVADLFDKENNH